MLRRVSAGSLLHTDGDVRYLLDYFNFQVLQFGRICLSCDTWFCHVIDGRKPAVRPRSAARPHARNPPRTPSSSLASSPSPPSDASPKRSRLRRHIKELGVIYRRFNHFPSSSETAIKMETAPVHKSVQHLISSRNMGEVGIFCQIPVAPSQEESSRSESS